MKTIRKVGVAATAVLAGLGALTSVPSPAGAWSTPSRVAGVRGININGSGGADGLSYVGAYGIDPTGAGPTVGFCVQWEGAAPNPNDGAYALVGATSDPILANAAAQMPLLIARGATETEIAAFGIVGKFRSNQLGLPGATIYGAPGGANPTGPASFLLSDGTPPPTEYNSGNPTSAAALANAAWAAWQTATANGIGWTPSITLGAHPGLSGAPMTATITIRKADGTPVGAGVGVGTVTATNGGAVSLSSSLTNAAGQATATWVVTNGAAQSGIAVDTYGPGAANVYRPTLDGAEQTIVGTSTFQTISLSALAPAPTGTVKIEKLDNQTGAHVAGATLQLKQDADNNGSYEATVGTYTSGTSAITLSNRSLGDYQLIETAAPAGYQIDSTPATGTLTDGGTLTLSARNNQYGKIVVQKIDGVDHTPVVGASLELTGPAPSTAVVWSGLSGAAPVTVPNLKAGVYTLTETAPPAGYHVVSQPVTTTLAWGSTATVSLSNYLVIGGETTASETVATTDGSIAAIYDSVILTGVHADQVVSVTATLYTTAAPDGVLSVDLTDNICTDANATQTITVDVTGPGPHLIGPFTAPDNGFRGVTTFSDGVTGAGPQSWLDHCGQPKETVLWYPPIQASTQAMDVDPATNPDPTTIGNEIVSGNGARVWDRVSIDGLATGETATITAVLYSDPNAKYPFSDPVNPDSCIDRNQLGDAITITVTGANDADTVDVLAVGPFKIPKGMQGRVTFADTVASTVTSGDAEPRVENRNWSDACGTPSETLTVRRPVTAVTNASVTTTLNGKPLVDPITADGQLLVWDSIKTNLNPGETASVTAVIYGYYPADTAIAANDCVSAMALQTFTATVTGPGPHKVGPFHSDAGATGQLTWKDGLTVNMGEDTRTWSDTCGTPSETKTIRKPIKAITTASHTEVTNTGDVELYDEVTVDGLQKGETAHVIAKLYGPFTKRPTGDSCAKGVLLATFEADVTGPGPHRVGPYKVPADMVGYVTWQDGAKTDDGRSTLHGCGLLSETTNIVAQPPILTPFATPTPAPAQPTANSGGNGSGLAQTGTNAMVLALIGAALVSAGCALLFVRRRKTTE